MQKALEAISTSSGRDGVLQQADNLITAASAKGNRDYLWRMWVTIATAWGVPTASTHAHDCSVYIGHVSGWRYTAHLRNLLVKPGVVMCYTARVLSTIVLSSPSRNICARAVAELVPQRATTPSTSQFCESTPASLFGVPVSSIHNLVLNVWWVTREIETTAAPSHARHFQPCDTRRYMALTRLEARSVRIWRSTQSLMCVCHRKVAGLVMP